MASRIALYNSSVMKKIFVHKGTKSEVEKFQIVQQRWEGCTLQVEEGTTPPEYQKLLAAEEGKDTTSPFRALGRSQSAKFLI